MKAANRTAYTFIEMLVMLSVLLLASAIALPSFAHTRTAQKKGDFRRRLQVIANEGRTEAIFTGHTCAIEFEPASKSVRLLDESTSIERQLDSALVPESIEARQFTDDKYESGGVRWRVRFYPDGFASGGAIEFIDGDRLDCLVVPKGDAPPRWIEGAIPDLSQERWDAGGYEKRS